MSVTNYASSSPATSGSPFDLALAGASVAGATVASVIRTGSSLTFTANLDPAGANSAMTVIGPIDNGAGRQYFAYAQNVGSGTHTVRWTPSGSGAPRIAAFDIPEGLTTSFDVSASNTGTGTALTGGATATTAQANEEAIGAFSISSNETFSQSGSWAIVGVEPAAGSSRLVVVHQTLSATGTPNAAVTGDASAAWIGQTVTFRISGGAAAHSAPVFRNPPRIFKRRRYT